MTPEERIAELEQRIEHIQEQMRVLNDYLHHLETQAGSGKR